jgi:nuclear transport factor 2 (NTF2) superfamily protein
MKKSLNVLLLFAFAISLTVWSCKPKQVISETTAEAEEVMQQAEITQEEEIMQEEVEMEETEECAYTSIEGKGTIMKLNLSNPNEIAIKFNFEPNDEGEGDSRFPEVSNENVTFNVEGLGKYPTSSWCQKNNIEQGKSFDCVRYEFEGGDESCETVYFSFTEFEGSGW